MMLLVGFCLVFLLVKLLIVLLPLRLPLAVVAVVVLLLLFLFVVAVVVGSLHWTLVQRLTLHLRPLSQSGNVFPAWQC